MRFQFRLLHKGIILVSVPLIAELVFVGILFDLYTGAEIEAERAEHAKKISDTITGMLKDIVSCYRQVDGEALYHPGFDSNKIRADMRRVNDTLEGLKVLVKTDKTQSEILRDSEQPIKNMEAIILRIGEIYDRGNYDQVKIAMRDTRRDLQLQVKTLGVSHIMTLAQEQQDQLDRSPEVQADYRRRVKFVLAIFMVFNIALTLALAVFFSRGISRRIATLTDNSMRLAQGKPLHQVMQGTDEVAHLDQVFHSMADALAEAERSKQEVLGMVTHDLKTPLTTVSALLEMLEDGMFGKLNDQGIANLKVVTRNVLRMNGLIRDLLDIEKIKSGKLSLFREDVSVPDLLHEAVDSVRSLADDRKIALVVKADEVDAYADNHRMLQILINLLSNAIKFSPENSQIIVSAKHDGSVVHVAVQDFGRGIPADKLQAVFERFEQTKVSDATVKGGTGLGLAICKALVELHGGQIGVTSQEGKGSTFFFTVPVAVDVTELPSTQQATTA